MCQLRRIGSSFRPAKSLFGRLPERAETKIEGCQIRPAQSAKGGRAGTGTRNADKGCYGARRASAGHVLQVPDLRGAVQAV